MWDVAVDLVLGSSCVACGRPGRVLCPGCQHDLPRSGRVCWPTPAPRGLAVPIAAGHYADTLKVLVNAHKEQRAFGLARPLGGVLAAVVRDLVTLLDLEGIPLGLVPVPSRGHVVRRRGHDPLLRTSRHAGTQLRRTGVDATVTRLLVPASRVRDQAGLGARDRAANLEGAFRARRGAVPGERSLVVVDDVITTGATAREAQRALETAGYVVAGVAALAATRRRIVDASGRASLPLSARGD